MLIGLQSNVESPALLFLCSYRVKSIPYKEFYRHKHEKHFQNVAVFPCLCNFISQTRHSFAAESKSRLFQGQMKQVLA